jgi:hypothetical protein
MSGALHHSRSAISIASVISVVASEPHEYYRRHVIISIDNSQVGSCQQCCAAFCSCVKNFSVNGRCCIALLQAYVHRSMLPRPFKKYQLRRVLQSPGSTATAKFRLSARVFCGVQKTAKDHCH